MTFTTTPQQAVIYQTCADPRSGNIAVSAGAGCGKTFTLQQAARQMPGSGLATSVLKSTTADLAIAMPSNFDTKGMHSLGYTAIRKRLSHVKLDTKGNALYEFCKEALKGEDAWWKLFPDIKSLVEQAETQKLCLSLTVFYCKMVILLY